MPDERIVALEFVAIGPLPPAFVSDVAERVSRAVALPCRVGATPPRIEAQELDGRPQLDADRLLGEMERLATRAGVVLAALAARDIGSPIFTHFFGRARLGGRALVVSVARLRPAYYGLADDATTAARRAALEVAHELGHVAGLRHCDDAGCLMRFAHSVEAIDSRGATWCAACAARLPRGIAPAAGRGE
jgi:archaemetzincin